MINFSSNTVNYSWVDLCDICSNEVKIYIDPYWIFFKQKELIITSIYNTLNKIGHIDYNFIVYLCEQFINSFEQNFDLSIEKLKNIA